MKALKPYLTTALVAVVVLFAVFRVFPIQARKLVVGT